MTTTYNGTNIGLEYDAAAGTWGFKNIEQNFVDTNTFSTADPSFEYAPVPPADDPSIDPPAGDPCPPGYIFDKELQQCVPDPNYQNPFRQDNNQGPREEPVILGTGRELPSKFSSGGGLFPYSTDAPTRAQQNEHMLLQSGISLGWLVDNGKGQYIKSPFNEKQGEGFVGWAGLAMKYFNKKSYNDYFNILENGWQPEGKGLWDTFLQGNSVYSLKGGMKRSSTAVGGIGDDEERIVEYYGYSPEFQEKVNQAQSINGGMIDRDGNVNINADNKGGYYREDGKFVLNNGQVVSFGSLSAGLNYISKLKGSGLKLSKTLRDRLAKGIDSVNFNPNMLPKGFTKESLKNIINTYKQEKQTQTDIDLGLTTEETKDDGSPISTEGDTISDDGTVTTPSGDTYTPTGDGQGYTFESGYNTSYTTGGQGSGYIYDPTGSGSGTNYGTGRGSSSYEKSSDSTTSTPPQMTAAQQQYEEDYDK
jgi:hypothetical protein